MKRIKNEHGFTRYLYKGYEVRNHGYYPPDQCTYWEAININTGESDFHAKTKGHLKKLMDDELVGFIAS